MTPVDRPFPKDGAIVSPGGFIPPAFSAAIAEEMDRDLERLGRNIAAETKARTAGATGYLRESVFGGTRWYEFPPEPSRRERVARAIAETRRETLRRIREAARILWTGSTSYDDDYDF